MIKEKFHGCVVFGINPYVYNHTQVLHQSDCVDDIENQEERLMEVWVYCLFIPREWV